MAGYFEEVDRLKDLPLDQLTGDDRMLKLWLLHPETSPEIREPLPFLIDPPSQWAQTEQHERFRKTMAELVAWRALPGGLTR